MLSFAVPPADWSPAFLERAVYLTLNQQAQHPGAWALVELLVARIDVADVGRRSRRRSASLLKLQHAVAAIVGGLLRAWSHRDGPKPVRHSNEAASFSPRALTAPDPMIPEDVVPQHPAERVAEATEPVATTVGRRLFRTVMDQLVVDGLVAHKRGLRLVPHPGLRMGQGARGRAARYWPTAALLRLAEAQGLSPANITKAFRSPAPRPLAPRDIGSQALVVLRPFRVQRWAAQRDTTPFGRSQRETQTAANTPPPPDVALWQAEVAAQNALAATTPVQFPAMVACYPPCWYRVFSGSWRLQGRWYARGQGADIEAGQVGSYAGLPAVQRSQLLIGGAPVVELDINASHLTLLLGLLGGALPSGDPYEGLGYPRAVIKQWVLEVCGKGRPPRRWAGGLPKDALAQAYRVEEVGRAVLRRYPVLEHPEQVVPADLVAEVNRPAASLVTHYLAAQEAAAISLALDILRRQGILALPVHDSLIVANWAEDAAQQALQIGVQAMCGLRPRVAQKAIGQSGCGGPRVIMQPAFAA
jgi:hypothetical protein